MAGCRAIARLLYPARIGLHRAGPAPHPRSDYPKSDYPISWSWWAVRKRDALAQVVVMLEGVNRAAV
jgi:hypothetical protein